MISTPLRALLLASALLTAIGAVGAPAEAQAGVQPVRYVCNADGRCFETGDLDRQDADDSRCDTRRPPPPYYDREDFDRAPPSRDFDRRGPRDDDDPD